MEDKSIVEFEYALDKNKRVIFIENAIPHERYSCLTCGKTMFARLKKGKKAIHFYHLSGDYDHRGESKLHYNTKGLFYEIMKKNINLGKDIFILQECPKQSQNKKNSFVYDQILYKLYPKNQYEKILFFPIKLSYKYSLLDGVNEVKIEKSVGSIRPDVSLFKDNKLVKAIEIVHTHDDSEEKTLMYKENCIDVLKVFVQNEDHLKMLKEAFSKKVISSNLIQVNPHSGGCKIPLIFTKNMLVDNTKKRELLNHFKIQIDEINKQILSLLEDLNEIEKDYSDFLNEMKNYFVVYKSFEEFIDLKEYFEFTKKTTSIEHFKQKRELQSQYLVEKFTYFRRLFDKVDYETVYIINKNDLTDLLISWAKQKHYNPDSLLMSLNEKEYFSFLDYYPQVKTNHELSKQAKFYFDKITIIGWYHFINTEQEIIDFLGEEHLNRSKKIVADMNEVFSWHK